MSKLWHKLDLLSFGKLLSIFYDDFFNAFFWTPAMRDDVLHLAAFNDEGLEVLDVGSGTGFCTEGIVAAVLPTRVTCLDENPHHMAYARRKSTLEACTFIEGDAQQLPFDTDQFDRYVSAGSLAHWEDPQRGLCDAYRVLKPGGLAVVAGPLRPRNRLTRALAEGWMLFPEEEEYELWFQRAGFVNVKKINVRPRWVRHETYGVALVGMKPTAGPSPLALPPVARKDDEDGPELIDRVKASANGTIEAAMGFAMVPVAMVGRLAHGIRQRLKPAAEREPVDPVTPHQLLGAFTATALLALLFSWLLRRKR